MLLGLLQKHLLLHTEVFGQDTVRPKMHWAFDVAEYIKSEKPFMDCLVIERLHLRVRGIAQHCKKLGTYEKAVCGSVLNHQCNAFVESRPAPGLQGPQAPLPSNAHIQIADSLCLDGTTISVNDVVCRGASAARVLACCFDGVVYGVVVDEMRAHPEARLPEHKFVAGEGSVQVWLVDDITPCVAWTRDDDPCIVVFA